MKIFQTYSGLQQRKYVSSEAIPYDYTGNGGTEYEIFKDLSLSMTDHSEPWGALSWKFEVKTHTSVRDFIEVATVSFAQGADCVFINPMIGAEALFANVWEQGVYCGHIGMEHIVSFLLERGHLRHNDLFMRRERFAFCNYFVARNHFWRSYFKFVDSVVDELAREANRRTMIGSVFAGPSSYSKNQSLSMRPFVIERLFSTFISRCDMKVCSINSEKEIYKAKFGNLLGNTLFQLSEMKANLGGSEQALKSSQWRQFAHEIIASRSFITVMHLDDPDFVLTDIGMKNLQSGGTV